MAILDEKLIAQYTQARLARDSRFDGVFFTGVTTTGIYCRSICPATPPKAENVIYFSTAISAAESGFRPCLRCRPDSAPHSCAWQGNDTTLKRAIELINTGALQEGSIEVLAAKLGITSRYLRKLFAEKMGTSPKRYATYQQCLFAKQLLHDTRMSITDIAFASGFKSVRRFNEAMQERLSLTPTQIRQQKMEAVDSNKPAISLKLYYRQPFAWNELFGFLHDRVIPGLEWAGENHYGRTIEINHAKGWFEITSLPTQTYCKVTIVLNDLAQLYPVVQRLKTVFDLNAPIELIDQQLQAVLNGTIEYLPGLRVPGIWANFEAGVRAVLGQQVSVQQAHILVSKLVEKLGEVTEFEKKDAQYFFPSPEAVANSDLAFFRMPQARKDALRRLAQYVTDSHNTDSENNIDDWLQLKGIGPWTINYVKLRALKDPDVWLAGDAGIKNALNKVNGEIELEAAQPWRSYLVFQLWNQL